MEQQHRHQLLELCANERKFVKNEGMLISKISDAYLSNSAISKSKAYNDDRRQRNRYRFSD